MKILHFSIDDKFLPFMQQTFEEVFPGSNEYRILGDEYKGPKFGCPGSNVFTEPAAYWFSHEMKKDLDKSDCLVIHFMARPFLEGIRKATNKMVIIWIAWGGDYADLIEPYMGNLLLPQTNALLDERKHGKKSPLLSRHRNIANKIVAKLKKCAHQPGIGLKSANIFQTFCASNISIEELAGRIDIIAGVNPREFSLIRKALPNFKGQFHNIQHYSTEETFDVGPATMSGPDILVGNSATPSNNHIEAFDHLTNMDLEGRKLICPLNYGDSWYAETIAELGRERFGNRFVPLRQFLSASDYCDLLGTCGTVLMNHVRQQAGSTIALALYKGASVFLRKENPMFGFYGDIGARVFAVPEELSLLAERHRLRTKECEINRRVIGEYWSHNRALSGIAEISSFVATKQA